MLASFQRISKLINRQGPAHAVREERFSHRDVHSLAVALNLEKRGKRAGEQAHGPALDAAEAEVVRAIVDAQQQAHGQVSKSLADIRHALLALDLEGRFGRIRVAAAAGLSDLAAELQFKIDGLHDLRRGLQDVEVGYQAFRVRNHLDRPDKVVSRSATVLWWLVLLCCLALSAVVNGQVLGETGALSLGLAGLNIGVALLFARYGVPQAWRRFWPARLFGILALGVYLALAVGFNLALSRGAVVERLLDEPTSWLFCGLGILLSLVAFVVGLNMREIYPGYAREGARYRAARARYDGSRERLIAELSALRARYEEALALARADLTAQRAEHDALVAQRQAVVARFEAYQDQLESDANALLAIYREAQAAAHLGAPPACVQRAFALVRMPVRSGHEGEWSADELKAAIRLAQGHLDWLLLELQRLYEAGIAEQVADPMLVNMVSELAKLARAQGKSVTELARLGVAAVTGARDWPPTIALGDAQLPFAPESAEISAASREQIRTTVMQQVLDLLKRYPADVIEVVGHTDEQPVSRAQPSSMDDLAIPVLWREQPASSLLPADNAGLGLARAIAVASELAAIGPDRIRVVPLSAAHLLLPGDKLSRGRDADKQGVRQRIEIRLRQSMAAPVT